MSRARPAGGRAARSRDGRKHPRRHRTCRHHRPLRVTRHRSELARDTRRAPDSRAGLAVAGRARLASPRAVAVRVAELPGWPQVPWGLLASNAAPDDEGPPDGTRRRPDGRAAEHRQLAATPAQWGDRRDGPPLLILDPRVPGQRPDSALGSVLGQTVAGQPAGPALRELMRRGRCCPRSPAPSSCSARDRRRPRVAGAPARAAPEPAAVRRTRDRRRRRRRSRRPGGAAPGRRPSR